MTKKSLIDEMTAPGAFVCTRSEAEKAIDLVTSGIKALTGRGIPVHLRGFGSFEVKKRAARIGRNVRTGEPVPIPAKSKLTFKDK